MLDNLRLRLRDLPGNHPSAVRDACASAARNADPAAREARGDRDEPPQPGDSGDSGGHADPAEPADPERGERREATGEAEADSPARGGGGSLADFIRAVKEAGDGLSWAADADLLGEIELFTGGGSGDPYRPWFMSGEPGTPWFVAGEDL